MSPAKRLICSNPLRAERGPAVSSGLQGQICLSFPPGRSRPGCSPKERVFQEVNGLRAQPAGEDSEIEKGERSEVPAGL